MKKSFQEKINSGPTVIGTIMTLDSPEIAEILSHCGFDFLFFDMEHSALSPRSVQHLIQATKNDCSTIVRVPENSAVWIKKALDLGCDGIIIPQINTARDAKNAVKAAKYPPLGERSVGIARAQGYGMNFTEYVQTANRHIAMILQIEHKQAVENIDEIVSIDGVDGILIGPYDLSGSMNMLGQVTHPAVEKAITSVKQICKSNHIPYGIFVVKPEEAEKEIADGCNFITIGIDTMLLSNVGKTIIDMLRNREPTT